MIKKIIEVLRRVLKSLKKKVRKVVPIAYNVVENIKKIQSGNVDNVIFEVLNSVLPVNIDYSRIEPKVEKILGNVLLKLEDIEKGMTKEEFNQKLKEEIKGLNNAPKEQKAMKYLEMGVGVLSVLTNDKVERTTAIVALQSEHEARKNETVNSEI